MMNCVLTYVQHTNTPTKIKVHGQHRQVRPVRLHLHVMVAICRATDAQNCLIPHMGQQVYVKDHVHQVLHVYRRCVKEIDLAMGSIWVLVNNSLYNFSIYEHIYINQKNQIYPFRSLSLVSLSHICTLYQKHKKQTHSKSLLLYILLSSLH